MFETFKTTMPIETNVFREQVANIEVAAAVAGKPPKSLHHTTLD